jgi:hypothetical protein
LPARWRISEAAGHGNRYRCCRWENKQMKHAAVGCLMGLGGWLLRRWLGGPAAVAV